MNTDFDEECTCDIGVFAECESCKESKATEIINRINRESKRPSNRHNPKKQRRASAADALLAQYGIKSVLD